MKWQQKIMTNIRSKYVFINYYLVLYIFTSKICFILKSSPFVVNEQ